jgi:short-subunit dehydrogenase
MYDVNVFGVLYALEKLIPIMKTQAKGTIVGMSSLADARGLPASAGYNSSKAALTNMLEAARVELGKENIKVITVRPGFVKTDMTDQNEFKMPFIMPVEKAVRIIYKGIARKKSYIDFPFQMAAIAWLMARLPNWLFEAISKKM